MADKVNKLIFKDAESAKNSIIASQQKEIINLYNSWADDISERAKYYSHKTTSSAPLSERYYKELETQLRNTSQEVSNQVYNKVKSNMYTISDIVVKDNIKWLYKMGYPKSTLNAAYSYVPDDVVQRLVTGQVYESGWSLSKAIWGDNEQTLKDIYQVMAKGVAENKPIYNIAKELEAYVRPGAKLPWNLTDAMDGVRIYKKQVDYNAQRLARTLVQHSYQQSFVATTKDNPFVLEYVWVSNGSRSCPLCQERDGAIYKKDELPLDHPNGMCTMEPVIDGNMEKKLSDWLNGEDGTYPELDEFAGKLGYEPTKTSKTAKKTTTKASTPKATKSTPKTATETSKAVSEVTNSKEYVAKYGKTDKKTFLSYFNTLDKATKQELNAVIAKEGIDHQAWFAKYLQSGKGKAATKATEAAKAAEESLDVFSKSKYLKAFDKNDYAMLESNYKAWREGLSEVQVQSIELYTGSYYSFMNKHLRGIEVTKNKDTLNYIREMEGALSKSKLEKEIVTSRKTWNDTFYGMIGEGENVTRHTSMKKIIENKEKYIGTIAEDKAFISTSPYSNNGFSGDLELIIRLPKGTQAAYVDEMSSIRGERELLLNSNMSRFIIKDIEEVSLGDVKTRVYLDLIID